MAGPNGWPEFWRSWQHVLERLADRFTRLAPDLRGFGESDTPDGGFGPGDHAADRVALLDAGGHARAGIVGHESAAR